MPKKYFIVHQMDRELTKGMYKLIFIQDVEGKKHDDEEDYLSMEDEFNPSEGIITLPREEVLEIWKSEYNMIKEYRDLKEDWEIVTDLVINNAKKRKMKGEMQLKNYEIKKERQKQMKKEVFWELNLVGKEKMIKGFKEKLKIFAVQDIYADKDCYLNDSLDDPIIFQKVRLVTKAVNMIAVLNQIEEYLYYLKITIINFDVN